MTAERVNQIARLVLDEVFHRLPTSQIQLLFDATKTLVVDGKITQEEADQFVVAVD